MRCGAEIQVRDFYGATVVRFIANCHGQFLMITSPADYRNGLLLADWRGVLRELVALAVPASLHDHVKMVRGDFAPFSLAWPLVTGLLAGALGQPASEIVAELAGLAIPAEYPMTVRTPPP